MPDIFTVKIDFDAKGFVNDFSKNGYVLKEDVLPRRDQGEVAIVPVTDSFVGYKELLSLAKHLGGNLGQLDAEKILLYNKNIFPNDLSFFSIVFPGTIWERQSHLYIPAICRDGMVLKLQLLILKTDWHNVDYILVPLKK